MTKLTFLGAGAAFTMDNFQSNMLITSDLGKHLLIDCGGDVRHSLAKITTLDDYFIVHRAQKNGMFHWEGIDFRMVQVVHYMDGFDIVPSYGLMFEIKGKTYFITTDTQFNPNQIRDFYNMSDVIFQDCETAPFKSGVHAHYTELITLHKSTKKKMYLYHYQDGDKPDCKEDSFKGWVKNSQVFELK